MSVDEFEERWAVSRSELDRLEELNSKDELIGAWRAVDGEGRPAGDLHAVVVLRNGTVTDRNADGSVGVAKDVAELIADQDELRHPATDEDTEQWIDVVTGPDGRFVRFLDERPAETPGLR